MKAHELLNKLVDEGYSLRLIARQIGVPYMNLYRSYQQGRELTQDEEVRIKRFAIVQPCMEN